MAAIDEYLALLPETSEEAEFLRAIPWVLDAGRQDPEALARELREDAPRLETLPNRPLFSLITPMYNTPPRLLRELILSLRCQSYTNWELILVDDGSPRKEHLDTARDWANRDSRVKLFACEENRGISGARNFAIEHASGDFLAILDHDDILHPTALGTFARTLNADPSLTLVFSNECQIDDAGTRTYGYFYKLPFDFFTLLRANYVCHFTAIRKDVMLAAAVEGRVFRTEYDGAEDHDLFARVWLTGMVKSQHIPLFLYYWRAVPTSCSTSLEAKPEIPERRLMLLDELIPKAYPGATYRMAGPDRSRCEGFMTIRLRSLDLPAPPKLLVVIPFRDDARRLLKALDALEKQRHDLDVTVILADGGSREPGTADAIAGWLGRPRRLRYVVESPGGFPHRARQINTAVRTHGEGMDLVLTLAPDAELKSAELLQTLAMQLMADSASGVLGVKILGHDGGFRHSGLRILDAVAGSGYGKPGPMTHGREFLNDERAVMAVSLACAMTRKSTFDRLGGLDEVLLTAALGDLDFCARAIEAGLRNYYFGTLTVVEHGPDRLANPPLHEFELVTLHERHARTLAEWRVRTLTHVTDPIWPAAAQVVEVPVVVEVAPAAGAMPMRYKLADRVNSGMKRVLGPFHGVIRSGVSGSWRAAKALRRKRQEAAAGPEAAYRPAFARRKTQRSARD